MDKTVFELRTEIDTMAASRFVISLMDKWSSGDFEKSLVAKILFTTRSMSMYLINGSCEQENQFHSTTSENCN